MKRRRKREIEWGSERELKCGVSVHLNLACFRVEALLSLMPKKEELPRQGMECRNTVTTQRASRWCSAARLNVAAILDQQVYVRACVKKEARCKVFVEIQVSVLLVRISTL